MMQFRDLQKQYKVLKPQIDAAVQRVCSEANFISGQEVKKLELQLAEYVGVKHCITCANGTDALTLILMAWGIGPGDAVLVPDFTFFASGETVAFEGATPIFVDVENGQKTVVEAQLDMTGFDTESVLYAVLVPQNYFSTPIRTFATVTPSSPIFLLEGASEDYTP